MKEEPVTRGSDSGHSFMRKHPDSKSGHQLAQEEMASINIKPMEGGTYGYLLAYPLDFELLDMSFLWFTDPEKEAAYQTATALAKNLLKKHGFPTDRGTKKEKGGGVVVPVFVFIQVMVMVVR